MNNELDDKKKVNYTYKIPVKPPNHQPAQTAKKKGANVLCLLIERHQKVDSPDDSSPIKNFKDEQINRLNSNHKAFVMSVMPPMKLIGPLVLHSQHFCPANCPYAQTSAPQPEHEYFVLLSF